MFIYGQSYTEKTIIKNCSTYKFKRLKSSWFESVCVCQYVLYTPLLERLYIIVPTEIYLDQSFLYARERLINKHFLDMLIMSLLEWFWGGGGTVGGAESEALA